MNIVWNIVELKKMSRRLKEIAISECQLPKHSYISNLIREFKTRIQLQQKAVIPVCTVKNAFPLLAIELGR